MKKINKQTTVKKKLTKKPHSIMHLEESAKNRTWQEHLEASAFMRATDDTEWRRRLINMLFEWASQEDALEIQQFLWKYKIPVQTFYDWKNKYEDINFALQAVKDHIGARRRLGVMHHKLHYQSAYRDMHMLAFRWAEDVDKYHADIAAKTSGSVTGIQVVEIERFADSPLVPVKKTL